MNIGIDIEISYCRMAVKGRVEFAPGYPSGEYLEELDVTLLTTPRGDYTFPSALWWHPDEPDRYVVGDEAKQMAEEDMQPLMSCKRSIGPSEPLRSLFRVLAGVSGRLSSRLAQTVPQRRYD